MASARPPAKRCESRARIRAARDRREHSHEVIFTSGGTEADNTAILSALETHPGRNEAIVSAVEHPAVLALVQHLAKHRGIAVRTIPVDGQGRLDLDAYRAALGPHTAIASIMWANNETGTIFPVAELAALAHEAGAFFHTDAVQAAGRIPIDVKKTAIDMLSLLGAQAARPQRHWRALREEGRAPSSADPRGGKQERGRRAGTENVPGIAGFGKAAELALARLPSLGGVAALRDRFEAGVLERIPGCSSRGRCREPAAQHLDIASTQG